VVADVASLADQVRTHEPLLVPVRLVNVQVPDAVQGTLPVYRQVQEHDRLPPEVGVSVVNGPGVTFRRHDSHDHRTLAEVSDSLYIRLCEALGPMLERPDPTVDLPEAEAHYVRVPDWGQRPGVEAVQEPRSEVLCLDLPALDRDFRPGVQAVGVTIGSKDLHYKACTLLDPSVE